MANIAAWLDQLQAFGAACHTIGIIVKKEMLNHELEEFKEEKQGAEVVKKLKKHLSFIKI